MTFCVAFRAESHESLFHYLLVSWMDGWIKCHNDPFHFFSKIFVF